MEPQEHGVIGTVLCLQVRPLYQDEFESRQGMTMHYKPLFCRVLLSKALLDAFSHVRELLDSHKLLDASVAVQDIVWFFDHTQRYHMEIASTLHVTANTVYFTGRLPGQQSAFFRSSSVLHHDLIGPPHALKPILPTALNGERAQSLISQIKANEILLHETYEAQSSKDALFEALSDVHSKPVLHDPEAMTSMLTTLSEQEALLTQRVSELEDEIQRLSTLLLRDCLGVSLGDWIYCDTGAYLGRPIKLVINRVDYYQGRLQLSGTLITKKNERGKREECIVLEISADEH